MSNQSLSPDSFGDLSQEKAFELLELVLERPKLPVQELVQRIAREDAERWIEKSLGELLGRSDSAASLLVAGELPLERMVELKDQSKRSLKKSQDRDAKVAALAGYFFSVAAALAQHQTRICSQKGPMLQRVLSELAAAAPGAWGKLLAKAATTASL